MSKSLTVSETLRAGSTANSGLLGGFGALQLNRNNGIGDLFTLSQGARERQSSLPGRPDHSHSNHSNRNERARVNTPSSLNRPSHLISDKDRLKLTLIERMMETLTGKKYKFSMPENLSRENGPQMFNLPQRLDMQAFRLERTETYHEFQEMTFQASGFVNTSDGRQIQFDINVFASYEFTSSISTQVDGIRLADPLIINFDGTLPEFTKNRYEFDLTIDGTMNNIFMPTNGSGFLAFDKNGDGIINDGSELFGARTGCGFSELRAYDEDGNGWIDEGDSIFEHLKIMFVDRDSGEFMLLSLKDAGIGAIYLGSTAADYEVKAADNELVGIVRRNGIFLYESGNVGSIHHIDLTY